MFITSIFAQTAQVKTDKYNNLKKLTNKDVDEVQVEIKKPDNTTLLKRTKTENDLNNKVNITEKIKKSNKLLY